MTLLDLARALHLIGVTHWIGGLAFVTLVVLPMAMRLPDAAQRLALFEGIEGRFAAQARLSVPVVGATGLWLLDGFGGWERAGASWAITGMLALWTAFMAILFIAEPLVLHARFRRWALQAPDAAFAWARRLHLLLLAVSAAVLGAGALTAHGALR